MSLNREEPDPVHNDQPASWDLVVADMIERNKVGTAKYGTPLQAFNGRDSLVDLYQELLDAVVYARTVIEERASVRQAAAEYRDAEWGIRLLDDENCNRLDPRWNAAVERLRKADAALAPLVGQRSPY